jgi:CelD/BcsL family acetyltransferase involved in cellulose biosynthesis
MAYLEQSNKKNHRKKDKIQERRLLGDERIGKDG